MTETLTGKQVLALLAQDDVPEIEQQLPDGKWYPLSTWSVHHLRTTETKFRIKPTPQRRLSVILPFTGGEVVSWPEPVREALRKGQSYYAITGNGDVVHGRSEGDDIDLSCTKAGNVHLTREAAQEHADALRKINCQEVGKC